MVDSFLPRIRCPRKRVNSTVAVTHRPQTLTPIIPPIIPPDSFEVRYVSANGGNRWNRHWVNVSSVCVGEYVGFEEINDGIWNVYFGPLKLGRLDERHMCIEDQ